MKLDKGAYEKYKAEATNPQYYASGSGLPIFERNFESLRRGDETTLQSVGRGISNIGQTLQTKKRGFIKTVKSKYSKKKQEK